MNNFKYQILGSSLLSVVALGYGLLVAPADRTVLWLILAALLYIMTILEKKKG